MRALLQRVLAADVSVDGVSTGAIGPGLLVFLGVGRGDSERDADYLAEKIANLRIFMDENGLMNRNVCDSGNAVLCISQFTLYANTRKGRRPSFEQAAPPELARALYEYFLKRVATFGLQVQCGVFQAHMQISLTNDGPISILIDTLDKFPDRAESKS